MYLCSPPKKLFTKTDDAFVVCNPFSRLLSLQTEEKPALICWIFKKKVFNSQLRSCSLNAAKDLGALGGTIPRQSDISSEGGPVPRSGSPAPPGKDHLLHLLPQLIKAPGDWPSHISGLLIKRRHFSLWKICSISFTEQHFLPLSDVLIRFQTG